MSGRGLQPADPGELRGAVRPLRVAAALLTEPLAAVRLSIGNAERLIGELSPELSLVTFSPFGALGRPAGPGAADEGEAPATPGRQAPRAAAAPPKPVSGALRAAGGLAPAAGLPGPQALVAGAGLALGGKASASARRAPTTGDAAGEVAGGGPGVPGVAALLGALVREVASLTPPATGEPRGEAPLGPDSASRSLLDEPARLTSSHAASGRPAERHDPAQPLRPGRERPSAQVDGTAAAPGSTGPGSPAAQALIASGQLDALRRELLATPLDPGPRLPGGAPGRAAASLTTEPAGAAQSGDTAAPVTADAPWVSNGNTGLAGWATGAQAGVPAPVEPQLDRGELAWLVNEALIEQARRHGVDLS